MKDYQIFINGLNLIIYEKLNINVVQLWIKRISAL